MLLPDEESMLEETMCILEGMCPFKQNFHLIRELISSFLQISLSDYYDGGANFNRQNKSIWPLHAQVLLDTKAVEKFMDLKGPNHHCGDLLCQKVQGWKTKSTPK